LLKQRATFTNRVNSFLVQKERP